MVGPASLRVVLVGGSGFLGRGLRERLVAADHRVTVIGRGLPQEHPGWSTVQWDARTRGRWVDALDGADAVVHLAGRRVDCRPTKANISELISSREGTVRLVGEALQELQSAPRAWVQLSSLAIFGDSGDELITEDTPVPDSGPRQQVEVCQRWEAAYRDATAEVERSVLLRPAIGIGGPGDPATKQLSRLARVGLGGKVGDGRQWVSWLAAEDLLDLLFRTVIDPRMSGLYHLTAPNPVQNRDLMSAYRAAVGRRIGLPSPGLLTKIGAWALGSDPALALTGRRCIPARLLADGYQFKITEIDEAVLKAVRGGIG